MKLIERIASWVGFDLHVATKPEVVQLRAALEECRQHKRSEEYEKAEACFSRAQTLAQGLNDHAIQAIVALHRADLLIRQSRFDEAETLLENLEVTTRTANERAQQAYTVGALGTLAQARGNWAAARTFYEQSLEIARAINAVGAEGRAMGHLADTYLHEHNASYAVHLLREALPKMNSSGDIELSSYFVGRLGQALLATGQDAEGDQMLGRALRLAEHLRYRRFERLWHLALGERAAMQGRDTEAYKHFEATLTTMPDDAPERLEIFREMAKVCLNLDKGTQALYYARRAVEFAPDDPVTQGVLGTVLRANGRSAEALPHLRLAVEHGTTNGQFDGTIWRSLAAAQADTGESDTALATFQQALEHVRKLESSDWRLEEARIQRDFGVFYARNHQPQQALKAWSAALEIYQNHNYHAQVARLYSDIASLRTSLGQGQRAMKDYEQALMALNAVHDPETRGVVLANAATAYVEQGDLETAESFFGELIKIAQKLQDRAAEATRRGNYGWFLMATGRTQRALSALEYAVKQSETLDMPLHLAVQTSNLALVQADLGDFEQALALHRRALALIEGANNPYWMAIVKINLAGYLLNEAVKVPSGVADLTEAADLLDSALKMGQSIENNEIIIRAQTGLARVSLLRGDLNGASKRVTESVNLARRMLNRRLLAEALLVAAELHAHVPGDHERAVELWEESRKLLEMLHHPAALQPPRWLTV